MDGVRQQNKIELLEWGYFRFGAPKIKVILNMVKIRIGSFEYIDAEGDR